MDHSGNTIALLTPALGTENIGDHFIELAIRRLLGSDRRYARFSTRERLTAADIDAINSAECAVLCGTNLYQQNWWSALTPEDLDAIRVPVIPFGVGSSASSERHTRVGRQTRQMIRKLHATCRFGSVRDPHTAAVVRRARVRNALMTGCPVLQWSGQPTLPEASTPPRRILVTARNWIMHHGDGGSLDHPVQVELIQQIWNAFDEEQLLFVVHEPTDRSLIDLIGISPERVVDTNDPERLTDLYSDPENAVLASRLHAGMLGMANGLQTVFVAHDTRSYSFCGMMGVECLNLFDERTPADSIARLRTILDGDAAYSLRTIAKYQELHQAMSHFLEVNELARAPIAAAA